MDRDFSLPEAQGRFDRFRQARAIPGTPRYTRSWMTGTIAGSRVIFGGSSVRMAVPSSQTRRVTLLAEEIEKSLSALVLAGTGMPKVMRTCWPGHSCQDVVHDGPGSFRADLPCARRGESASRRAGRTVSGSH